MNNKLECQNYNLNGNYKRIYFYDDEDGEEFENKIFFEIDGFVLKEIKDEGKNINIESKGLNKVDIKSINQAWTNMTKNEDIIIGKNELNPNKLPEKNKIIDSNNNNSYKIVNVSKDYSKKSNVIISIKDDPPANDLINYNSKKYKNFDDCLNELYLINQDYYKKYRTSKNNKNIKVTYSSSCDSKKVKIYSDISPKVTVVQHYNRQQTVDNYYKQN